MTSWANRYGPWALVTGAAMGLGQAYAEALAARGLSLLLVDVAEPELAATADRLARRTTVRTAAIDLGASSAADALDDACDGLDLGLAVHCAAVCP
ncbi:MAG: SDR family NAD(P)-dependent oxidoreductase, partial [Polyangiaceae bacterium]